MAGPWFLDKSMQWEANHLPTIFGSWESGSAALIPELKHGQPIDCLFSNHSIVLIIIAISFKILGISCISIVYDLRIQLCYGLNYVPSKL